MSRAPKLGLLVGGVVGLLLCAAFWVAPWALRRPLVRAIRDSCPSCEVQIAELSYSILRDEVVLEQVHFRAGSPTVTAVEADVKRIRVSVSPLMLAWGTLHFNEAILESPVVVLTDGDAHSPKDAKPEERPYFDFHVGATKVRNGHFTYVRDRLGLKANLVVTKIEASIGALGNSTDLVSASTEGRALAQLERSGRVDLKVAATVFKRPLKVRVDLELEGQDLADLSTFFSKNDGLYLKGHLVRGESSIQVEGARLKGWTLAQYRDFSVRFEANQERSPLGAFFSNLGATVALDGNNLKSKKRDQIREVELEREAEESLVSFILRGMKDAALDVASKI
jgi:hypothetical protein